LNGDFARDDAGLGWAVEEGGEDFVEGFLDGLGEGEGLGRGVEDRVGLRELDEAQARDDRRGGGLGAGTLEDAGLDGGQIGGVAGGALRGRERWCGWRRVGVFGARRGRCGGGRWGSG